MASQGLSFCQNTRVERWKQELASLKQAVLRRMNATTTSRNPRRCLRIELVCLLDLKNRGRSTILEMKTGDVRDQKKKAVKIRAPLPIIFCAASLMQLQLFAAQSNFSRNVRWLVLLGCWCFKVPFETEPCFSNSIRLLRRLLHYHQTKVPGLNSN